MVCLIAGLACQFSESLEEPVMNVLLLEQKENIWRNNVLEYIVIPLVEKKDMDNVERAWKGLEKEVTQGFAFQPTDVERVE